MHGTRDTNAGPIAGFLLILAVLVTVAACGACGAAAPSPSAPASPSPSVPATPATPVPTPAPTEQPSAAPSEAPAGDGIDLDTADDHDVVVVIAFTQPAPPADSGAMGFDRVLVLDFASPVRGEAVTATFATQG